MILYKIRYSPWSLRAKWALDHHDVSYEAREYVPMASGPRVRLEIGDWSSKVSVPLLIAGDEVFRDSIDIARHADSIGTGSSLFQDDAEVIETWTAIADQIADTGRVLTGFAVAKSSAAKRESLPRFVPGALRGLATPIVDVGWRYVASKYSFSDADAAAMERDMRAAMERVGNRLVESEFLGEHGFGWPDIAVAAALQFVEPAATWVKLGPGLRDACTRHEIAKDFADVLSWRDNLLTRFAG